MTPSPVAGVRAASTRPRFRAHLLILLGVALLVAVFLPVPAQQSSGTPATDVGAVTKNKTVSRTHLIGGKNVTADKRTVTLEVDQTRELHDRQEIEVTWSGAHPSDNKASDPNSIAGADQEYPMVLLECRGIDAKRAPAASRMSPETCWTQTPTERYFASPSLSFPPWRVDRYADAADRKKVVGAPKPLPSKCFASGYPEHWLHFIAVNGAVYDGGPQGGCAGIAPEQTLAGSTVALPGNTTYAFTGADGTGQAKFAVWTELTNASLGCGPSVPCSLVAVPVEGISCDVAAAGLPSVDRPKGDAATSAAAACTSNGGQTVRSLAVAGSLWWSASNWRNRITVPLQFAPLPATECRASSNPGVDIYGSELLTAATSQWSSKFCADPKLFPMTHVQTGETQARSLLQTGNTNAAFTSLGPDGGWGSPIVSAPTAMTGFAVGYAIDDARQHEYAELKLTPRLLAKLLTESYPAIQAIKSGWATPPPPGSGETDYTALAGNPLNISKDPEFIALNPGITQGVGNTYGAATLLMLSSDSDVVHALTSYINADPEARAWLDGQPDPWGMVVNPNYRGIALPVDNWPLLDTYEPREIYNEGNPCLQRNPVPYLPLVASPMIRLSLISLNLQYAIQQSQVVCADAATSNPKLVANGPEAIGFRFIIGITSLADAQRYRIDTAALQTRVASDAPSQFADGTGRTFVAPADDSLRAAAGLLAADRTSGIWRLPYDKLVGADGSQTAYPGAMLVSTAIPTEGLPKVDAADYATFLSFAAGAGQTPGGGAGELPAGYLPLTSSNGLGAEQHYTQVAAQYVAAQNGKVPDLTSPKALPSPVASSTSPSPSPRTHTTSTAPADSTAASSVNAPAPTSDAASAPSAPGTSAAPSPSGSSPAATPASSAVAVGATQAINAGLIGTILPVLALIGLAAGLGAPALRRFARRRSPHGH